MRRIPETILECAARLTNEYESLWIMVMLVASAISTSTMMILGNKYRARALLPSPLPRWGKGRGGEEEEVEMV